MSEFDPVPWQTLSDAYERHQDARRAVELMPDDADEIDRALAEAELLDSAEELKRARSHLAALGELLILVAIEQPGAPVQKALAAAFNGLAQTAYQNSMAAMARADWMSREIDALKTQVAELQEQRQVEPEPAQVPATGRPVLRVIR